MSTTKHLPPQTEYLARPAGQDIPPKTFPSAIGKTRWEDIRHHAGTYLTYFPATDRSGKTVRSLTQIGPPDHAGTTVHKTLVLYHDRETFHYEGHIFPAPNNNRCILLEKPGHDPAESYLSFFKEDTRHPSENRSLHFVAVSCDESFRNNNAHFPTAYRELFIRYDEEISIDFLGAFSPDRISPLDPRNPRLDRFYLNKLRQDLFTDDPFLQVSPSNEECRLGRGRNGYGDDIYDQAIEFLVKIEGLSVHRLHLVMTQINNFKKDMDRQGIPGDARVFRRHLDPFLLTVSVTFSRKAAGSARKLCYLLHDEFQTISRQYSCIVHELAIFGKLLDDLCFSAPCTDSSVLTCLPSDIAESGTPDEKGPGGTATRTSSDE